MAIRYCIINNKTVQNERRSLRRSATGSDVSRGGVAGPAAVSGKPVLRQENDSITTGQENLHRITRSRVRVPTMPRRSVTMSLRKQTCPCRLGGRSYTKYASIFFWIFTRLQSRARQTALFSERLTLPCDSAVLCDRDSFRHAPS